MFLKRLLSHCLFTFVIANVLAFPDSRDDRGSFITDVRDADGHNLHLMEGDIALPDDLTRFPGASVIKSTKGYREIGGGREREDTAETQSNHVSWQLQQHQSDLVNLSVQDHKRKEKNFTKKSEKYAISDNFRIWPNGVIPYTIDPSLWSSKRAIIKAMRHIESKTCIRFVPARKNEHDYIRIYRGGDRSCFSMIGRSGGRQAVSLGNRCLVRGVILHELVHSIGFYHQQTRSDRDKYLKIIWSNIDPAFIDQFRRKMPEQNRILRPFDYDSIMLYGPKLFSRNGQDTMVPIKRGIRLLDTGVKNGLSDEDVTSINLLYGCHDAQETDESENSRETGRKAQDDHVDRNIEDAQVNETDTIDGKKYKANDRRDIFRKTVKVKSFYASTVSPVTPTSTNFLSTGSTVKSTFSTGRGRRVWSRNPWIQSEHWQTKSRSGAAVSSKMTSRGEEDGKNGKDGKVSARVATRSPWSIGRR